MVDTLKILIDQNSSTVNFGDKDSDTALHLMASFHTLCGSRHHFEDLYGSCARMGRLLV
jgi:hypothetical protein